MCQNERKINLSSQFLCVDFLVKFGPFLVNNYITDTKWIIHDYVVVMLRQITTTLPKSYSEIIE